MAQTETEDNRRMAADRYVYVLYRADGVTPFYVGKGKGDRWLNHERKAQLERSHKASIIRQILAAGLVVPKRIIARNMGNDEACELEVALIQLIGRTHEGGTLTNVSAGGDGNIDPTPECKARIAATLTGRVNGPMSAVRRARISAALTGVKRERQSDAVQAKRSASLKANWATMSEELKCKRGMNGKKHSVATREKMRASALGKIIGLKQRALASARHKGRVQSLEEIAKRRASLTARWAKQPQKRRSEETRRKNSEAAKRYWAERIRG